MTTGLAGLPPVDLYDIIASHRRFSTKNLVWLCVILPAVAWLGVAPMNSPPWLSLEASQDGEGTNPNPLLFCVVSLSLCNCPPPPCAVVLVSSCVPVPCVVRFLSGPLVWFPCASPTAELVQLGLLGSLGNLPVSERVQLPHFRELRLHHGGLGVHREGDRVRACACGRGMATVVPLRCSQAPGDSACLKNMGSARWGDGPDRGPLSTERRTPEGEEGYGELGGVKASFPE